MQKYLEIARTGVQAVLLHRLQNVTAVCSLLAVLVPFLVGLGISHGLQRDAAISIAAGADLYVTAVEFGRPVPLPLSLLPPIQQIDGVHLAFPRIVGEITLGAEALSAVVVGLPADRLPDSVSCIDGGLPAAGSPVNELVVGSELATRLHLKTGDLLPPFYRNRRGEKLSRIAGIFRSDASLWQSRMLFTTLETAGHLFDQEQKATEFLVYCRPGYQAAAAAAMHRLGQAPAKDSAGPLQLRITSREEMQAITNRNLLHREGVFDLHFVLLFAAGILVVMVTAGIGLAERRREVGLLKAAGWQTDEVLLRSFVEALILSIVAAALAIVVAYGWMRLFNGYWIAGIFIPQLTARPAFNVPFQLLPIPGLLAFVLAMVLVLSGSLYSAWRAAIVPPREALR